jgi:hypothetical protein
MSIKELRETVKVAERNKKIINIISNEGSVGKTILSLLVAGVYKNLGMKLAKFTLDKHHQELLAVHGQYSKGQLVDIEKQDPIEGVAHFDVREDGRKSIDILGIAELKEVDILLDNPADGIDEQNKLPSQEAYVRVHKAMKRDILEIVPIATADKSIASAEAMISTFDSIDIENIHFLFVFNEGLIGKNKKDVHQAFKNSQIIQDAIANGQASTITIKTKLEPSAVALIKSKTFEQLKKMNDEGKINLFDWVLLDEMINDFERDFLPYLA